MKPSPKMKMGIICQTVLEKHGICRALVFHMRSEFMDISTE